MPQSDLTEQAPGQYSLMQQAYGQHWNLVKDYVDEEGWFPDYILGESNSLSVWVLSECEKKRVGDEVYWRLVNIRNKLIQTLIIGKHQTEAVSVLEENKIKYRVSRKDGVSYPIQSNHMSERFNLTVEAGFVIKVTEG